MKEGARVAGGVDIGPLTNTDRQRLAFALIAAGAAAAIATIFRMTAARRKSATASGVQRDLRLVGATRFARKGDDDFV